MQDTEHQWELLGTFLDRHLIPGDPEGPGETYKGEHEQFVRKGPLAL
jgi:hypothetical protein